MIATPIDYGNAVTNKEKVVHLRATANTGWYESNVECLGYKDLAEASRVRDELRSCGKTVSPVCRDDSRKLFYVRIY